MRFFLDQRGDALLSVLASLSISSILLFILLDMNSTQTKSLRFFSQKADAIELKQNISKQLNLSGVCDWQFSKAQLGQKLDVSQKNSDGTLKSLISLSKLYSGLNTSSEVLVESGMKRPLSGLEVEKIEVRQLKITGVPNQLLGSIFIYFRRDSMGYQIAPIAIDKSFYTKSDDPENAKEIIGCSGGGGKAVFELKSAWVMTAVGPGCLVGNNPTNGNNILNLAAGGGGASFQTCLPTSCPSGSTEMGESFENIGGGYVNRVRYCSSDSYSSIIYLKSTDVPFGSGPECFGTPNKSVHYIYGLPICELPECPNGMESIGAYIELVTPGQIPPVPHAGGAIPVIGETFNSVRVCAK